MIRFSVFVPCLLLALAATPSTFANDPEPASQAPRASQSLLLDLIGAGERFVAVGERGHVLLSEDGREWRQSGEVPVRSTLTRLAGANGHLWAVGHDTTIIHSRDNGETWSLQNFEPERESPLLDVLFFDDTNGLAIGAYGLVMRTSDGGESWEAGEMYDLVTSEAIEWPEGYSPGEMDAWDEDDAWEDDGVWDEDGTWDEEDVGDDDNARDEGDDWNEDQIDAATQDDELYDAATDFDLGCYEFKECHLNAITRLDGERLFIVAERGFGYRSEDAGETWEAIRFPYPGSMFGVVATADDCLVAFGLRGNIQKSCDFADSWELLESATESSLMGGTVRSDGRVVIVAANGEILELEPDGTSQVRQHRRGSDLATVLEGPDGLVLVGEDGVQHD